MATLLIMELDRVNLENVEVGPKHWRSMVGVTEGSWACDKGTITVLATLRKGGSTTHCSVPIPKAPTPQETYSVTFYVAVSVSHHVVQGKEDRYLLGRGCIPVCATTYTLQYLFPSGELEHL